MRDHSGYAFQIVKIFGNYRKDRFFPKRWVLYWYQLLHTRFWTF